MDGLAPLRSLCGILVYILWPLRRNTSKALEDYYQGKVEDLLTPRIHNYDF